MTESPRRQSKGLAALCCALSLGGAMLLSMTHALAEPLPAVGDFPSRPIRFISAFPPGGGNDGAARTVTAHLSEATGQPAVVENRGGAGGNIGARAAIDSKPDGYTVFTSQVSIMAVNPALYASAGFDPLKDFIPITQYSAAPLVLVVRAESPLKRFADLVAKARAEPGRLTYASPGNGTLSHLVGVVLGKDHGVEMTHIPYKGSGPAVTDLLGGQVDLLITSTSGAAGMLQAGKMRALAVTSPRRSGVYEKVPTLEELGFSGARFEDWYGFFAPSGTPPERVDYLHKAIVRTLNLPQVRKIVTDGGGEVVANTRDEFTAQMKQDIERWGRVVKLSGAKID